MRYEGFMTVSLTIFPKVRLQTLQKQTCNQIITTPAAAGQGNYCMRWLQLFINNLHVTIQLPC